MTVTFTCDLEGCDKTDTIYKSRYDSTTKHFCSKECNSIYRESKWVTFTCEDKNCNEVKRIRKSQYDRKTKKHNYCSLSCAGKNSGGNTSSRGREQGYKFEGGYTTKVKPTKREDFDRRWKEIKLN